MVLDFLRTFELKTQRTDMISFPNCKINIGLNVISKRSDGYHDIETVFYPVNYLDALEIKLMKPLDPATIRKRIESHMLISPDSIFASSKKRQADIPCCSLRMTGNDIECQAMDNLVVKAYTMLLEDFDLPAIEIELHKHIPSGAGLGGGSADGAFMISLLNRRFNLRMKDSMMERYAARLGSDCAFFIKNKPAFAEGRGEVLSPVDLSLSGRVLVIVKPDVFVSTAEAYAGVTPKRPQVSLKESVKRPVSEWKGLIFNDFEESVFARHPQLAQIKEKLYFLGAEYAAMSGSGSALYGIFKEPLDRPSELFPGMFCCQRELL